MVKKEIEQAPHRALLGAVGYSSEDWSSLFVGVMKGFNEIVPGHSHISSQAAEKGPIAAMRDGDITKTDMPKHKLEVKLGREGLKQRLASLPAFEPRISTGYLERYNDKVSSASTCAVFSE
jgi:dihydroxyacid dehydratase/phosphogluconate dehydratase